MRVEDGCEGRDGKDRNRMLKGCGKAARSV